MLFSDYIITNRTAFVRFSPPVYSYSSIQAGSGLSLRGESLGSLRDTPRI